MNDRRISRGEWLAVLAFCAAASTAAIVWSSSNGAMLNYGDAVAHLHIARRVFDSHRPGVGQFGSVWLPLPHVLMLPFVQVYAWWANGVAGMIPSALAWLAACAGIYRLARRWMGCAESAIALAFFATNFNLLYLQTTAMTEPLFLCEMIWVVVWLVEWRASLDPEPHDSYKIPQRTSADIRSIRPGRLIWQIAIALTAAVLTRYDGWVMAFLVWVGIGGMLLRRGRLRNAAFWTATVLVVAAPVGWLVYNAAFFGDWLTFMRGPYSAQAIEMRTAAPGWPPHPGWHNPWTSLLFFVKTAELDAAAKVFGNALLAVSVLGMVWGWLIARGCGYAWTLLLWLPVPFYAYSVAYGAVPIFIPTWWPHSYYNTRYGLEMLPALALGFGLAAHFVLTAFRSLMPNGARYAIAALFLLIALNDWRVLCSRPLVYIEGIKNIEARRPLERDIPPAMRALLAERPGGVVLMDTSVYPNLVAFTGIPLLQTVNESDKEYYRDALAAPSTHAALVLAFDGDQIAQAVAAHPGGLKLVRRFTARGQPSAALYVSDTPASTSATAR